MIMTAAIGFLMIIAIVALLLKGKCLRSWYFAVIPVIAAPDPWLLPGRGHGLHCGWN